MIDGKEVVNNYPEFEPKEFNEVLGGEDTGADVSYDVGGSENVRLLPREKRNEYIKAVEKDLFSIRLDEYTLPSLFIKVIKSMKKNGVVEVRTNRIDKLQTNFANEELSFN